MSDSVIDTALDGDTQERLDKIAVEITPDWMDEPAAREETIRYLAHFYFGEVEDCE